jgi:hypothetical protein
MALHHWSFFDEPRVLREASIEKGRQRKGVLVEVGCVKTVKLQ